MTNAEKISIIRYKRLNPEVKELNLTEEELLPLALAYDKELTEKKKVLMSEAQPLGAASPSPISPVKVSLDPLEQDLLMLNRLNDHLLSHFRFSLIKEANGYSYRDARKSPPRAINPRPLASLDEALKFIGVGLQRLYIKEAENYKKGG